MPARPARRAKLAPAHPYGTPLRPPNQPAAAGAHAGRVLAGAGQGAKPLGYVPKGCSLAGVQVEATYTYRYTLFGPRVIRGTVKLSNGNDYAVPISKVQVTLAPAVPVSPFILTASCPSGSVPANPQAYQYGEAPAAAAPRRADGAAAGRANTALCQRAGAVPGAARPRRTTPRGLPVPARSCAQTSIPCTNPGAHTPHPLLPPAHAAPGTLTCTFESPSLPTSGPAAGFGGWKTANAVVTIGMSGATCSSKVTQIKGWILTDLFDTTTGRGSSSSGMGATAPDSKPATATATTAKPATASHTATASKPATARNPAGAGPLLVGHRRLSEQEAASVESAAPAPLGYVPPSDDCQGLTISATASMSAAGVVSGTVFIANPQQYAVPLASVTVAIANNVPVAPIFVDARCQGGMSVPTNPQAFQLGTLVCSYSAQIPAEGIASDPSKWTSVMPKVTVAMSNAQCSGAVAPISQPPSPSGPVVYGH